MESKQLLEPTNTTEANKSSITCPRFKDRKENRELLSLRGISHKNPQMPFYSLGKYPQNDLQSFKKMSAYIDENTIASARLHEKI